MATFKLQIELGNDAMCRPAHVHRALRQVADQVAEVGAFVGLDGHAIMDVNGNLVGGWGLECSHDDGTLVDSTDPTQGTRCDDCGEVLPVDDVSLAVTTANAEWLQGGGES